MQHFNPPAPQARSPAMMSQGFARVPLHVA